MLGSGFGFCFLPVLRELERRAAEGGKEEERGAALRRHVEHFNAHPYLSGLALGATARMELDGASPEEVRRFKMAIRGPLGSVGDRLIWAAWLPATLLGAMTLALLGTPWWFAIVTFLVVYNSLHLRLRTWSVRVGLEKGPSVAETLRRANLIGRAERIASIGVLFVGLLVGLLVGRGLAAGISHVIWPWLPVGALLLVASIGRGRELWAWAVAGLLAVVGGVLILGISGIAT